jgi:VanZ family protein
MRRVAWRWLPVAVYMAAIFALSSRSSLPSPIAHVWDKALHAIGYAPLAWLVVRALTDGFVRPVGIGLAVLAWTVTSGYGLTDEWHQSFVPKRTFDLADLAADAISAATVIALCAWWSRLTATAHPAAMRH